MHFPGGYVYCCKNDVVIILLKDSLSWQMVEKNTSRTHETLNRE